ncbi:HTH-type transcriptional regulator GltC [Zhongshania aliphaticivorans]|uniref:HTH-type transcriptional regulator GltC n=1 Tax=Zhongshania aliphaticivorans TaxID=1470434 RepID=A0A5S9PXN3_9GAMM|nr:HTH-type transcriptional activator IlvY [Zhongshania aliphaticivorans]CAA0109226.1 HTH-type transcriptional regulator GltC [Zhongshania aliphaticivorans]CAA0117474.1 HTH-type transcriptional regulator GltC [Zhongshania aliphaticivorans]
MNTKELEIFIDLARTLHFGRTGAAMHLSASAVSRSIMRLEEQVGVALFERDNRRVQLSAAGREFLGYAEQAVVNWRSVLQRLHSQGEALQGELKVYCSVTASYSVLSNILEVFRRRYPAIELKLHTGDQADAIERIVEGGEDVGITAKPKQLSSRLQYQELTRSPLRLLIPNIPCAVNEQVAAMEGVLSPSLLADLPFILPERGVARTLIEQWFRQQQIKPSVYAQVSGHEAIVSTVALGLGIGIVPELVLETSFLRERVRVVPVEPALPNMEVGVIVLQQRLSNPLAKAFWECAKSSYSSVN